MPYPGSDRMRSVNVAAVVTRLIARAGMADAVLPATMLLAETLERTGCRYTVADGLQIVGDSATWHCWVEVGENGFALNIGRDVRMAVSVRNGLPFDRARATLTREWDAPCTRSDMADRQGVEALVDNIKYLGLYKKEKSFDAFWDGAGGHYPRVFQRMRRGLARLKHPAAIAELSVGMDGQEIDTMVRRIINN